MPGSPVISTTLPVPDGEVVDVAEQEVEFARPAHERAEAALDGRFEPRPDGATLQRLVGSDRTLLALHLEVAYRTALDVLPDRTPRALCQEDATGRGRLLHARCHVGGVTDRRVVEQHVVADAAHDDGPGAEADAEVAGAVAAGRYAASASRSSSAAVTACTAELLERTRRAEQRHDAVAAELGDRCRRGARPTRSSSATHSWTSL